MAPKLSKSEPAQASNAKCKASKPEPEQAIISKTLHQEAAYRREEDGSRYGGYFSQEDLRELVAYAEARHITIIPELELPGHSQAALSAYPQFSCLGADANIEVVNDWGVFKEIYCAGNASGRKIQWGF